MGRAHCGTRAVRRRPRARTFASEVMISRIPTWSFKSVSFSRTNVTYFLIFFTGFIACLVSFPWATLVLCCFAYAGSMIWAFIEYRMDKRKKG